jgi:diguanylate cyclase
MLEGYSSQLEDPLNVDQVRAVAREIIAETRAVGDASRRLQVQLVATSDELEDLRRELDHLRLEANTDMLTRVLNRRGFDRALAAAVANAAEGAPCCLLLVDVDRFKEVNDTYGHLLGDKVLRLIAELMLRAVKGRDVVARLGGDEFAVILPETALAGAKAVAESIRRAVEKSRVTRRDTGAVVADVTVSIGVVAYQAGAAPDAFLHRADEALYQAKGAGRNRVTLLV